MDFREITREDCYGITEYYDSERKISLQNDDKVLLKFPDNTILEATIKLDHTTHPFSDHGRVSHLSNYIAWGITLNGEYHTLYKSGILVCKI